MLRIAVAAALVVTAAIAGVHAQQPFPSRQITLVVPFPPGGSTDAIARIMADRMRGPLGQPVVTENVGGAGGSIAVGRVARAQPDGYTIDIGQWDTHVGSIIYKLNYDLQKDFDPIGLLSVNPQLMVAKKNLPANNLKDLVAWMKANPGKITFVNQNAAAQVTGLLFEQATGQKVLWVGGPAIVHTGAAPAMVELVNAGYVDVLFAGNALATHDIEAAMYGTSLGVDLARGSGVEHGHEHHIRAINAVRKAGSIAGAVQQGILTDGIMHALVQAGKPFVLVGSVRDDGPLPDVYADVIEGQRAMRAELSGVGFAIMVATMLHSVATGNILPASIPLVCVDINQATVTKLADRGSAQAQGIVTDIGLFLEQLAFELVPDYRGLARRRQPKVGHHR